MPDSLKITLLGAGRVAAQLAPALADAGHRVVAVWSRRAASAAAVAAPLGAAVLHGAAPDLRRAPAADLYLLAVPDDAAAGVLGEARWPSGALVAHTSGALPLALFAARPEVRGGVFYPLQTFSPGRVIEWAQVPLCLEAADAAGLAVLQTVAASLSQRVLLVGTPQRRQLHVAAVFASNFTNHLLGVADALLAEAELPADLLAPLVRETVDKALQNPPFQVQTGPAIRRDAATIATHTAALAAHPRWQALYEQLTASIQAAAAAPEPPAAGAE
ncbi:DUF2520 domain-containing protein [Hymenobacter sp. 15J16-1T3B]|uniref:Rossmann-like and DUF2520 domain-containing protein n=1 Tax=Hymenobacter sp. 15J16-1T3B TaxID=2886941 RepID=UPI001D103E78|nr:Rossmann-like and DUF2520 domain-containing protein [Hymenobacter sp. 15J16-1T3B]MCC3157887.1 DUF2520 domain-containing protein [Hymenobacter sp. 15J16-1T3B]